jgi:uncharacterized membrane protein YebE (DUF533 family)
MAWIQAQEEALLYIRAMIADAAADGEIDDQERGKIKEHLERVGLDGEERDFLQPIRGEVIARAVPTLMPALLILTDPGKANTPNTAWRE